MFNFYVDAYADMFGTELEQKGLLLAPSKIVEGKKIIDFSGYKDENDVLLYVQKIQQHKLSVQPLDSDEWYDFFSPVLDSGQDVIFFSVSFGMLGDKGLALKSAFAKLNKNYPTRKAILVDTHTVSRGTSEIASLARIVYNKNQDIDEALDFADTIIGKFVSVFALDNVDTLKKNALLSPIAKSFSGATLNLKPIVCIDTEGKFKLLDKAKGYKSALSKLYSNVKENGLNVADYTFSIVSFNADTEAKELYDRFRKILTEHEIRLVKMSPNNAIFTGDKIVALTFHSKY